MKAQITIQITYEYDIDPNDYPADIGWIEWDKMIALDVKNCQTDREYYKAIQEDHPDTHIEVTGKLIP